MRMTFRWYGTGSDSVTLKQIKQIPACEGIVGALYDVPVGEVWPLEKIMALKNEVEAAGLTLEVIESVNVHEDIKLGLPSRDRYIENYCASLENLAKAGIKVICYNFMPIFDWLRTDLAKPRPDGATALSYTDAQVAGLTPDKLVADIAANSRGFMLPGWEPERLVELESMFEQYSGFTEDTLFANLKYFLEGIIPTAEKCDIKMAIHPDDPPWPIFGLPRIINSQKNLERFTALVDNPYNCLTLCTGSLGSNRENDIPAIIRYFGSRGRIAFTHIRNVKFGPGRDFEEAAHLSSDGSLDMFEIVKAYHDVGFTGYARPDHGRMIWDEAARPGYGLYDRALGIAYLNGLWEAIGKMKNGG